MVNGVYVHIQLKDRANASSFSHPQHLAEPGTRQALKKYDQARAEGSNR
jgi:hypothetical protein